MPEGPSRTDGQKLGLFSSQGKGECSWEVSGTCVLSQTSSLQPVFAVAVLLLLGFTL